MPSLRSILRYVPVSLLFVLIYLLLNRPEQLLTFFLFLLWAVTLITLNGAGFAQSVRRKCVQVGSSK